MPATDKLTSLHRHEDALRAKAYRRKRWRLKSSLQQTMFGARCFAGNVPKKRNASPVTGEARLPLMCEGGSGAEA